MGAGTVVHRDKASFQEQYGTLWLAAEAYIEGKTDFVREVLAQGLLNHRATENTEH